jgi:hypothetical protein
MTIGRFSLAEPALAQVTSPTSGKKVPPKRTSVALSDRKLIPEPR